MRMNSPLQKERLGYLIAVPVSTNLFADIEVDDGGVSYFGSYFLQLSLSIIDVKLSFDLFH